MVQPLTLVAHRGLPERYPENSLAGVKAAIEAGAKYIEVDIQFSSDCVPFIYHDENMQRMSGLDQSILQTSAAVIKTLTTCYPSTETTVEKTEPIADLQELCELISTAPETRFFLELKRHSVEVHGANTCVTAISDIIEPVKDSCIPISFHSGALTVFRNAGYAEVGWIIRQWDSDHHKLAVSLAAEYLFCNIRKMPTDKSRLWQGPWQWVLYTVNDMQQIMELDQAGFSLIETNQFDQLQPLL